METIEEREALETMTAAPVGAASVRRIAAEPSGGPLDALLAVRSARDGELLLRELSGESRFRVRGPMDNAVDLLRAARSRSCDIAIVDIRLPDLDALETLQLMRPESRPRALVLVSERPADAVRAFEVGAVDFLESPLESSRLRTALRRARRRLLGLSRRGSGEGELRTAGSLPSPGDAPVRRLIVRDGSRWSVVPVEDLLRLDGERNYVRVTLRGGDTRRIRGTLRDLEDRLDPRRFLRVHRSTIVRLDEVVEFARTRHGDFRAVMSDGSVVITARARGALFLSALEGHEEGGEAS